MTEGKFVGSSIFAKEDKRSEGILDCIVISKKMLDLFFFDLINLRCTGHVFSLLIEKVYLNYFQLVFVHDQ